MVVVTTEESDGSALPGASPETGGEDSEAEASALVETGADTATEPGTVVVVVDAEDGALEDADTGADEDVVADDVDADDEVVPICAAGRTVVFCVTGGEDRSAFMTVSRPEVSPRCQFCQSCPP